MTTGKKLMCKDCVSLAPQRALTAPGDRAPAAARVVRCARETEGRAQPGCDPRGKSRKAARSPWRVPSLSVSRGT
jgi:hypothetical protein